MKYIRDDLIERKRAEAAMEVIQLPVLSLLEECLLDCSRKGQRTEAAGEEMLALDEYLLDCVSFIPEKQEKQCKRARLERVCVLLGFKFIDQFW